VSRLIPQAFIEDLLSRVDIVDVVARGVKLKKAGADYVACCPFHSEKTPSFTVSPGKQFYHCFGCGKHGNAISFLIEHEGMEFRESVEMLANQAGIKLPAEAERTRRPESAVQLSEVLAQAARFYRMQLRGSNKAISYLKSRGVTGEAAAHFGLGYAPDGWQNLTTAFADYHHPALLQAGLVVDEGRRYDRFRDRIIFPILNHRGQVIGFGGRAIGGGEPKYLNSPESPLFEKGRELYGLFHARRAQRGKPQLIVVEGYMDVLMLAQHGIENVVATLGTATTPHHVDKLLRQADELIFCFDGDDAGKRAAWRALEIALSRVADGKQIAFSFLPPQHDPDSFVREFGREEFAARMKEALPLSEFLVRELGQRFNLTSGEGRTAFLHAAKPLIQSVKAPVYSLMLRNRIAEVAGIARVELDSYYRIKPLARARPARELKRKPPSLERRLLQCLLANPALASQVPVQTFTGEEGGFVLALLEFLRARPQVNAIAGIMHHFFDSEHGRLLREIELEIAEQWSEEFDVDREFAAVFSKLQARERRRQIELLLAKSKTGWSAEDKAVYRRLAGTAVNDDIEQI
jgi:DNA primase